jgi:hypothetical protein
MEITTQPHGETAEQAVYEVDPSRLETGAPFEQHARGDIAASYSADKIAFDEPVRKPFVWQGALWLAVSTSHRDLTVEAYRVVAPEAFDGEPVTYARKVAGDGEAARRDPLGFYHGMLVKRGAGRMVMCGPPARFRAGQKQQRNLFEDG